jgi:hypothetical protein
LVWSVAGLIVLSAIIFGVTAAALPGCSSCHDAGTFVDQTKQSGHAEVRCVRCHVQAGAVSRVVYAYSLIFGMTLRIAPTDSGPAAAVADSTCLSCHAGVMEGIVTANGLSIRHDLCSKGRMCIDCHGDTAHGTAVQWPKTAQMNQCLDCHSTQQVSSKCDTCHSAKSEHERLTTGEWVVTHGPNWRQTHGMGDWNTCAACHAADYCQRCHGISLPHPQGFLRTHPTQALARPKDCAVCHKQAFCDDCHGMPMPHPAGFTPAHSAIVEKQGSLTCMRCHVQDDCNNCHVAHVHPGGATLPPGSGSQ